MIQENQSPQGQFERFFAALFRPDELVELRLIESWTSRGKRRSRVAAPPRWIPAGQLLGEYDELVKFAESPRANIYFGVCPRPNEGDAVDQSITTVRCLWCDIDDVTAREARRRWKVAEIPQPSLVVHSGGGVHAYWLLDRDLTTAAEREHLAGILPPFYAAFDGDHVQNFSRVMRPPGTMNYKEARNGKRPASCSLISYRPERKYSIDTFAEWMESSGLSHRHTTRALKDRVQTKLPSVWKLACHDDAEALASRLELPSDDRSRRDFAVVCDLLRLGLSPAEIWMIVADKSKFESNGRPYFDLTIANAEKTVLLAGNSTRASQAAT